MKTRPTNYLYNFYTKDDGDGTPVIIVIDGFKVQIGINVAIMPDFHVKPSKEKAGQLTIVGSNSFLGKGESIEEGSIIPEGTIMQGEPLYERDLNIQVTLVGDDFGRREEANRCIVNCFKNGLLHHASLMVNCPPTKEAVSLAQKNGLLDKIGLHFNVLDGKPQSKLSNEKHYDMDIGHSFGSIINGRRSAFFLFPKERKLLKDELKEQIHVFRSLGFSPKYFDSHGNVHFKWPVAKTIYKVLLEAGFTHIRIPRQRKSKHRFYDFMFKRRVMRLYKKHFQTPDAFLSASDLFQIDLTKFYGKTIEIMAHPFIKNGKFINRRDVDFPVLTAFFKACSIQLLA